MKKAERAEFNMVVENTYDELMMKTEGRGISWGEVAYIEGLSLKDARALLAECETELEKVDK